MKWTNEQREAIEKSGQNLLVAAAAGSGKTAVLVQRIIELISRASSPVDINRLLVLTFTDAAAREMREKISDAIDKALAQNPKDPHLQKQKLLIHSSGISTIHSFCLQLLKNNIHMTDLPVNFSLISETENKMLLDEVLNRVLERFYGKIDRDPSIAQLVMGYGGIKNDTALRETILRLLSFSKSMPYPAKWLCAAVKEFKKVAQNGSLDGTLWQNILSEHTKKTADDLKNIYSDIQAEIENHLAPDHPYKGFFDGEARDLERVLSHMNTESFSSVRDALLSFSFERMASGTRRAEGEILAAQEKIKALRQLAKNIFSDLWELYKIPESDAINRIKNTYPLLRTLKNIVLISGRSHTKAKREKGFLDFSDLEHETLKLLSEKNGVDSPILEALREKYHEILIDEYQDTNNIQETIFKKVSRDSSNIFMVGDLKQSIYAFRNAVPKLFSDKYISYAKPNGGGHLVKLFKNFRSRTEVVDTVNFIFKNIMSPMVGDVGYTEDEYLIRGAEYPPLEDGCDFTPEFHFVCSNAEVPEGAEPLSAHQLEATIAAKRIREVIDSEKLIYDKNTSAMRPVQYRDIVVLMRNTKTAAPVFEETFEKNRIPVYTEVGRSYLNSIEVQTVLSFLKIVDNPRQDIPLIAVMRSPLWGFSPEELGEIRALSKEGCFFDVATISAERGNIKVKQFLNTLDDFRQRAEYQSTEKLIWSIYHELGYYAYSGAGNRGAERQANLRLLFERAADFEHTGLSGLFNFMNYIEAIKSRGDDLAPAKTLSDGDNVVRIMTIHKSKGLEFPIVILADTAHSFNMTDLSKNILWNTDAGIGADFVDTKMRVRYPSLPRDIVALYSGKELISEEMRLLYVALTRAREQLIVTASFKQTKSGISLPLYTPDGKVKPAYIQQKKCFRDWLLAAILPHPDSAPLREYFGLDGCIKTFASPLSLKTFVWENQNQLFISQPLGEQSVPLSEASFDVLSADTAERLAYTYPARHLTEIPVKLSVSEAKRMQEETGDYTPLLKELRPTGIKSLEKIEGAEKGTIVHFVLQKADPRKINSLKDVTNLVDSLVQNEIITALQAAAIEPEKILRFFESSLGRRIKNATRLEREFSFYTKAPASEILGTSDAGDILLQGTMDCFFVEADGTVVLLDFKTDKAKTRSDAERLSQKYKLQMKYYKKALSEILDREVNECYLYFLDCGEMIAI